MSLAQACALLSKHKHLGCSWSPWWSNGALGKTEHGMSKTLTEWEAITAASSYTRGGG